MKKSPLARKFRRQPQVLKSGWSLKSANTIGWLICNHTV